MRKLDLQIRLAKKLWSDVSETALTHLKVLISEHDFSIPSGDILNINGRWYVTYAGLLGLAHRRGCTGISVRPIGRFCDPASSHWTFEAIVYKTESCKGFAGYGDASPSNVSALLRGAELRIAETRAVSRALRKAYGIGICSIEEIGPIIGTHSGKSEQNQVAKLSPQPAHESYGNSNGSRVRDRLWQLIRQHALDANLVKSYAVDFCGTKSLREATREQVENFVVHLADWAEKDRNALLCQLNSYSRPQAGAA
jgi:hypothetical protein